MTFQNLLKTERKECINKSTKENEKSTCQKGKALLR